MTKILVVDDEPLARKLVIKIVENSNNEFTIVGEADNAREAFEKYRSLQPDVVITDICRTKQKTLEC